MSKKFVIFLASFFFVSLINKLSAQQIQRVNDSTIIVPIGAVVPEYNTYFLKSAKGKSIATFKAGQKVRLKKSHSTILNAGEVDCRIIPCPGTFGPQTTCWECRPRPQ